MRLTRITFHCLLLTSFLFLLSSCQSTHPSTLTTSLLFYNFDHSAFAQYSANLQPIRIPFSIPLSCGLDNTFSAPVGQHLLIELNCPNGQTVLFLDSESGSVTQPVTDSDAHFLAWTSDGKAAYLKVDSLGSPEIIRVYPNGKRDSLSASEYTYDLSAQPDSQNFTFTFSRGMGQGSELWLAQRDGKVVQQVFADQFNYISYARWSPDGSQIAFIKTPDSQIPFTVGELWVMDADGVNPRKLADVDTGHGFAANWSPDGMRLAFVKRENPEDESANQSSDALISNIVVVDIQSGETTQVTHFSNGRAETPLWSPNGNTLAFSAVIDGRMQVQIADMLTGEIRSLITGSTCCPAWMRK